MYLTCSTLHPIRFLPGSASPGGASVKALVKHNPAHMYFTGRKKEAANTLIAETKKETPSVSLTFIQYNLTSFQSIKDDIKGFAYSRYDILI